MASSLTPREQAQALFYELEQQSCAVSALGDLLQAVSSDTEIGNETPYGIGALLNILGDRMTKTFLAGLEATRLPPNPPA